MKTSSSVTLRTRRFAMSGDHRGIVMSSADTWGIIGHAVVWALLILVLAASPAFAEPTLSLGATGAILGGTATVPVLIENAGALCEGVNLTLRLPAGVTLTGVERAELLSESFSTAMYAAEPPASGACSLVAYSTTHTFLADSGRLLVLHLAVSNHAADVGFGTSPVITVEIPILASGLSTRNGDISLDHTTSSGRLVIMREAAPVLDVTPLRRDVEVAGGEVAFSVENVGFLDMPWQARIEGAGSWLHIVSGADGVNSGVVTLVCEANAEAAARTANLVVDAGDVPGSPFVAMLVQTGDSTPCLHVAPATHDVPATRGLCSVSVSNTGHGAMAWSARVVAGFDWLSIVSGESGTDAGAITLSHLPNTSAAARTALVEVSADGAVDSPALVSVMQRTSSGPLLVVSPRERSVAASAGAVEFSVRNAGGGTMAWSATVVQGGSWLSIESGTSGVQDGVIRLAMARNTSFDPRTGTIRVEAAGAGESPTEVTVVQRARQLLAITAPNGGEQFARGESIAIAWDSDSETTEAVSLLLLKGGGIHSTIAVTADNSGAYTWTIPRAIEPGDDYQVQILDVANAAIHDASDEGFAIACPPDAPDQVQASDDRSDMVRVSWSAVDSAELYRVFRREVGSADGPLEIGTTATLVFEDTSARAPEKTGIGCAQQLRVHHYTYSVTAVNLCAESDLSMSDDGCRIEAPKALYAPALPYAQQRDGVVPILPGDTIAVRVRANAPIDSESIDGTVTWDTGSSRDVEWLPVDANDGWVVYRPEGAWCSGEQVSMRVFAATIAGDAIETVVFEFGVVDDALRTEPIWQPAYTDFDAAALDRAKETNEGVKLGIVDDSELGGTAFAIGPFESYEQPRRVWLPLPDTIDARHARVEYFHANGDRRGWYPAEAIENWLIAGSELELELDGVRYLGIAVRHGALVRIRTDYAVDESSAAPRTLVDTLTLGLALLVLGVRGRGRSRIVTNSRRRLQLR